MRDILLGEQSFDVDIAVEGDAIELADGAGGGAGRPRPAAREVRHGGRALRRRRPHRRRHDAHRVLRRAGRAADGRARDDPRGPLPPRLHDQRDGRLAQGRRPRPPRRPLRRPRRPRGGRRSASCTTSRSSTTRRGSSARSATRTGTASGWTSTPRGSPGAASRWGSSATSRRRAFATSSCCCSPRATSATRSCAWPSSAPTARSTRTSPPTRRRSRLFDRLVAARRRSTASRCPPGGSG